MRIKRGQEKHRKHKAALELTKGYRMSYNHQYRRALQAILHAGQYSQLHRRHRRAQMRVEWTKIISAALVGTNVSYSAFIHGLDQHKIQLDRKVLAEMAQAKPEHFKSLVEQVVS